MMVYVFKSTTQPTVYGYTPDPQGANLPPPSGPWKDLHSVEINPDGGVNTSKVLMGINDEGFYLTAAELKLD
jgi:hypothetical protein